MYSLEKLNKDTAFSTPGTVMTTKAKDLSETLRILNWRALQHPSLLGPRAPASNIHFTGRW